MSTMLTVMHADSIAYDTKTAATLLCVSPETLTRAARAGALQAYYCGENSSKALFLREDLEQWVRSLPTLKGGE